jgi:hypothetical protein
MDRVNGCVKDRGFVAGAAGAPGMIADRIARVMFPPPAVNADALAHARRIDEGLMKGAIDRAVHAVRQRVLHARGVGRLRDYARTAGSTGGVCRGGRGPRGGMTIRSYRIRAGGVLLELTTMTLPDGKIDQYIVQRAG